MNFAKILQRNRSVSKVAHERITDYFYGYSYPVITAGVVLLFWLLNLQIVGILFLVLCGCYIFITQRDMTPILPLLFIAPISFSDLRLFDTVIPIFIFAPALVSLIIHFIKHPFKKPFVGKVFFSHIGVCVALSVGGIFYAHRWDYISRGLPLILCAGVGVFAEYVVLLQYIEPNGKCDLKKYFSFSLIVTVLLAVCQFAFQGTINYFALGSFFPTPDVQNFAWANTNFLGYFVLLAVPMCFYLMTQTKKVLPLLIVFTIYCAAIIVIKCDGALGILIITILPLIIFTYRRIDAKQKTVYLLFFTVLAVVAVIIVAYLFTSSENFLGYLIKHFLSDTGRTPFYKTAWKLFKEQPLFGVGLGYNVIEFHSTIFEVLGCTGIFGLFVYIWYYVKRIDVLTKRNTSFNFFAFFSFFLYEAYASIDNGEFIFLMLYLTAVIIVTELTNAKKTTALPLSESPSNPFNKLNFYQNH